MDYTTLTAKEKKEYKNTLEKANPKSCAREVAGGWKVPTRGKDAVARIRLFENTLLRWRAIKGLNFYTSNEITSEKDIGEIEALYQKIVSVEKLEEFRDGYKKTIKEGVLYDITIDNEFYAQCVEALNTEIERIIAR